MNKIIYVLALCFFSLSYVFAQDFFNQLYDNSNRMDPLVNVTIAVNNNIIATGKSVEWQTGQDSISIMNIDRKGNLVWKKMYSLSNTGSEYAAILGLVKSKYILF